MVPEDAAEDGAERDANDRSDQDRCLIRLITQHESDEQDERDNARPDQGGADLLAQTRLRPPDQAKAQAALEQLVHPVIQATRPATLLHVRTVSPKHPDCGRPAPPGERVPGWCWIEAQERHFLRCPGGSAL